MNCGVRIKKLLSIPSLNTEEDFKLYIDVVTMNYGCYLIILARDTDEVFVNSYNPKWNLAWNRNINIQLCLAFLQLYNIISQNITEYYTKDDAWTVDMLVNTLKDGLWSLKEETCLLMNTYLTHQQMGEAKPVYKILLDIYFKESNTTTNFVSNCPRSKRNKFLVCVDEQSPFLDSAIVKLRVDNKDERSLSY